MKFSQIDRRVIFLLIFLGVAIPLIIPFGLPISVSENARLVYEMVENTPRGSHVLFSFDYDPASKPELHPMAISVIKHCLRREHKIIIVALWPMGVSMAEDVMRRIQEEIPLKYGIDYVNLGYKAGGMVTIQAMGKNMRDIFPADMNRTPIEQFPIMNNIRNFDDIGFVFSISSGDPGIKQYVMVAKDKFGINTSGGTTAVSTPSILPYVNEQRQLYGLLGGLKAAAEYEKLINRPGTATSGMDAQSVAHFVIIAFIVIANVSYWSNRKNKKIGM
ncbi:MAG: hypothetical protein PHR06_14255 [Candidatus Cloacimonetes bacterium]|nr:hypothetical protein [Candidatus Cloacimonadota bacterium]